MEHGTALVALIFEHFGKASPEQIIAATRFADAVSLVERERCAALAERMGDYTGGHGEPGTPSPSRIAAAIRKLP